MYQQIVLSTHLKHNPAKQAIFEYIEVFYNRVRLHPSNDYMSPADHESGLRTAA
ncbi:MAG: IS3 family transposase [Thiothrix sp.]|nr:IS3 family transposase [Thiothrix sp.]